MSAGACENPWRSGGWWSGGGFERLAATSGVSDVDDSSVRQMMLKLVVIWGDPEIELQLSVGTRIFGAGRHRGSR